MVSPVFMSIFFLHFMKCPAAGRPLSHGGGSMAAQIKVLIAELCDFWRVTNVPEQQVGDNNALLTGL